MTCLCVQVCRSYTCRHSSLSPSPQRNRVVTLPPPSSLGCSALEPPRAASSAPSCSLRTAIHPPLHLLTSPPAAASSCGTVVVMSDVSVATGRAGPSSQVSDGRPHKHKSMNRYLLVVSLLTFKAAPAGSAWAVILRSPVWTQFMSLSLL